MHDHSCRSNAKSFVLNLLLLAMTTTLIVPTSSAWSTKWINLDSNCATNSNHNLNKIYPPRSGHVAFALENKVYVFGGYAEESIDHRYPTNDLWVYDPQEWDGWQLVHKSATCTSPTPDSSGSKTEIPQRRLAAAAVTCQFPGEKEKAGLVLGGWDSQEAGTGGIILQDVQAYSDHGICTTKSWKKLSLDLQQPTSRLCAVTLNNSHQVLVHNHRCVDHVLIVDLQSSQLIRQPTSGISPSPRGLHVCVLLPNTNKMVLFGGAAQDGNMSNDVFLLDTDMWKWQKLDNAIMEEGTDTPRPSPRASPCMVAIDESTCILFGGACRSEQGQLHGCNDTWLLKLEDGIDGCTQSCHWTNLNDDGSKNAPPGRNAATLTPLGTRPVILGESNADADNENTRYFLLSGGWYPFRTTYNDNFVLMITK
jgi:Kelch motif/Galactose oxidase, central domain